MLTIAEARRLYQEAGGDLDTAHDFDHVLRVLANAERIGRAEGANMAVLRAATLLHDIGRAEQARRGLDHAVEGARRARQVLHDQPAEFVEAVCHAIAAHRFRNADGVRPQTLEAKILYDADKLDSIGAVGVARVFAYSGHVNRRLWVEDDDVRPEHSALQEFRQKLVTLKDKLFTATARAIAAERHQFMVRFFEQMAAEVRGER
ncbi:MAG: HD domain-containing protein [Anaerolineae bacterium]